MMKKIKIKRTGGPLPGTPSPLRGRPSPLRGRTFPNKWAAGPDPALRPIWRKWLVAKNQARFRNEEWSLTWEQYLQMIAQTQGNWGRHKGALNLARVDHRLGWHSHNVILKNRSDVMIRAARKLHGKDTAR